MESKLDKYIEDVADRYFNKKESSIKIAKIYNVSHTTILNLLEKNRYKRRTRIELGVERRIYKTNHDYFEKIDSPEKAYWLGFLYADGFNQENKGIVRLKLQEKDGYIIEMFNKAINSDRPISTVPAGKLGGPMKSLSISSFKMSSDLAKLGMIHKKSLILNFPTKEQVPEYFIHHFVRGYFDGDGSVGWSKDKVVNARVSICVTFQFGMKLKKILKTIGINCGFSHQTKIYHQVFGGRIMCLKFYRWLYQDANGLYLKRKKEKFDIMEKYSIKRKNSSSPYYGVFYNKQRKKYFAFLEHNRHKKHLGAYDTDKDAAIAYNEEIKRLNIDRPINCVL